MSRFIFVFLSIVPVRVFLMSFYWEILDFNAFSDTFLNFYYVLIPVKVSKSRRLRTTDLHHSSKRKKVEKFHYLLLSYKQQFKMQIFIVHYVRAFGMEIIKERRRNFSKISTRYEQKEEELLLSINNLNSQQNPF